MAKKFDDLAKKVRERPGANHEIEAHKGAIRAAMHLAELRAHAGKTQSELAGDMNVTQENVSRIERTQDAYVSTLERYVSALGGRLELNAVFPDEVIPLGALSRRSK